MQLLKPWHLTMLDLTISRKLVYCEKMEGKLISVAQNHIFLKIVSKVNCSSLDEDGKQLRVLVFSSHEAK